MFVYGLDELIGFGGGIDGVVIGELLLMVEDGLGESLVGSILVEIGVEIEGFYDWEVGFDVEERSVGVLFFGEDVIFVVGKDIVDIVYGLFGDLNFD